MPGDADRREARSFRSPLRALALGLAIGGAAIGGLWLYGWAAQHVLPDPTEPPPCYGPERANYDPPRSESIPLRGAPGRGGPSIDDRRDRDHVDRLLEAEKACTVAGCSPEPWERYRSALFWYLSGRLQHIRRLDRGYGQLGLRRAAEIYSEPIDVRIEKGLRDRYRAGIFRINNFRQDKDAIAILVLAGGAALRPCRKADVASK